MTALHYKLRDKPYLANRVADVLSKMFHTTAPPNPCSPARPRAEGPNPELPFSTARAPIRGKKGGAWIDAVGFDAGKKVKGTKRQVLTDSLGLMLAVAVDPVNVQDRDGAAQVVTKRTRRRFRFIEVIYADGGYQGPRVAGIAERSGIWRVEIVKRLATDNGFVVQPGRWIVARTLAWISRNRRLAKDFECLARKSLAFIRLAMIKIMLRRVTRT